MGAVAGKGLLPHTARHSRTPVADVAAGADGNCGMPGGTDRATDGIYFAGGRSLPHILRLRGIFEGKAGQKPMASVLGDSGIYRLSSVYVGGEADAI